MPWPRNSPHPGPFSFGGPNSIGMMMPFLKCRVEVRRFSFAIASPDTVPALRSGFPVWLLISGGNEAPRLARGMRKELSALAESLADESQKRPGWNFGAQEKALSRKRLFVYDERGHPSHGGTILITKCNHKNMHEFQKLKFITCLERKQN